MLIWFLLSSALAAPYVEVLPSSEPILREYGPFGLNDDMAKYMHQTAWMHSPQQNQRNPYLVTTSSDTFRPSPYFFGYTPPPPPMYWGSRMPYQQFSPFGFSNYGFSNYGGNYNRGGSNFHHNSENERHILASPHAHVPPQAFYPWFFGPGGPATQPMAPPYMMNPTNSVPEPAFLLSKKQKAEGYSSPECLETLGVTAAQTLYESYCEGDSFKSLAVSLDCTSYGYYQGSNSQETSDRKALDYCEDRCLRTQCADRCQVMTTDNSVCDEIWSKSQEVEGESQSQNEYGPYGGYDQGYGQQQQYGGNSYNQWG